MPRYLLALLLWLAAMPAVAQTVDIRSGEHADFSRLVFYFPEAASYDLVRTADGVELRTDQPYRFDTDGVFDLIPRDRIAALTPEEGRLGIELNCDCPAEIFDHRADIVVLDVKDGPSLPQIAGLRPMPRPAVTREVEEDQRPRAQIAPAARPGNAPSSRLADLDGQTAGPGFGLAGATSPTPLLPGAFADALTASASGDAAGPLPQPAGAVVEETARQVSRAAAQGLLKADLGRIAEVVGRGRPEPETPAAPARAETAERAPLAPHRRKSHVEVHTSVDRDLGLVRDAVVAAADGGGCLPDSSFDLADWNGGAPDGGKLSRHRAALLDASDRVDPAAVTGLTRYLISLSFGAEATAVLDAYPGRADEARLLRTMAEIVDRGEARDPAALQGQIGCPTAAALWAALAGPKLPPGAEIDAGAVTAAFSALPLHLRRHLGPVLAERFLVAGRIETAATLRDAIARAPGDHGAGFELLEAKIDLRTGQTERAEARLERLAEDQRAPTALALQLERKIEAREPVDAAFLDNVAATAHELGGTPLGARLKAAEIRGRAVAGDHFGALKELDRAARRDAIAAQSVTPLRAEIHADAAEHADDATFLRLAFRADAALGTDPDAMEARRALARRLMAHDLTAQARALVNAPDSLPTIEDRLILAEAAMADGRPDIAGSYIMGLDDPRAEELRARLREGERRGDVAAVQSAAANRNADEEPAAAEGVLKRNRALLAEAQEARQRLERLLADAASQG